MLWILISNELIYHYLCYRAHREYWEHLLPASGRPKCPSMATAADDYEKQLESNKPI